MAVQLAVGDERRWLRRIAKAAAVVGAVGEAVAGRGAVEVECARAHANQSANAQGECITMVGHGLEQRCRAVKCKGHGDARLLAVESELQLRGLGRQARWRLASKLRAPENAVFHCLVCQRRLRTAASKPTLRMRASGQPAPVENERGGSAERST